MKIQKDALVVALDTAKKFVAKNGCLPIIQRTLFDPENQRLEATDLETTAFIPLEMDDYSREISVPKTDEKKQFIEAFCVDPVDLLDMVKSTDEENIRISVEQEEDENLFKTESYRITVGENFYSIYVQAKAEFPELTISKTEDVAEVEPALINNMIIATTKDEMGFQLNTVLFDGEKNRLVSTDGHRLHMIDIELALDNQMVFPAEALKKAACVAGKEKIYISCDEKHVKMDVNGLTILGRNPDVKFPDYEEVLTDELPIEVSVEKEALEKACTQALILTSDHYAGSCFSFGNGISVEMTNAEKGTYEKTNIPFAGKVDPEICVGINTRYVRDALRGIDDENVTIKMKDHTGPFVFTGHGEFTALVMPMRV